MIDNKWRDFFSLKSNRYAVILSEICMWLLCSINVFVFETLSVVFYQKYVWLVLNVRWSLRNFIILFTEHQFNNVYNFCSLTIFLKYLKSVEKLTDWKVVTIEIKKNKKKFKNGKNLNHQFNSIPKHFKIYDNLQLYLKEICDN